MKKIKFTDYIRKNWIAAETLFGEEQYYYNPRNNKIVYFESDLRRLEGETDKQTQSPY